MSRRITVLTLIVVPACLLACTAEPESDLDLDLDLGEGIVAEIVENLELSGFPRAEIDVQDDGTVWVGGDALVTLEASREMVAVWREANTDDDALEFRQFRTSNLLDADIATICVNAPGWTGMYSTALDQAIAAYNDLGLSFRFFRGDPASAHCDAGIVASTFAGTSGQAGFPSNGEPYGTIQIGSSIGSNYGAGPLRHVIMHELGHCVGFRHSDYYNRSISCNTGGSETVTDGAINVPGTPSTAVLNGSVMNACYNAGSTGTWTPTDLVALDQMFFRFASGDFNGDGRTDVLRWQPDTHNWLANLSTGSDCDVQTWTGMYGSDGPLHTGDFNGDGRTDIIMWRDWNHDWTVNLSTGSGFTTAVWSGMYGSDGPIHTGDFNGDGRTDLMMWRAAFHDWTVNLSTGSGFTTGAWNGMWGSDGPIHTGDFNGDGRTDLMMWRAAFHDWTVNLSTGSGFTTGAWNGMWGSDGPIHTGDFNGDGRTDLMMWRDWNHDWTVNLSTGAGFTTAVWSGMWGSDGPIHTGDFNGDGRTDLMMWRRDFLDWTVNLSTGSGFNTAVWIGDVASNGRVILGDYDGNARTDVMMWRSTNDDWTVNRSTGTGFQSQAWASCSSL